RPDPRLRGHALLRPAVEPVHVDLRVEDPLRAGAGRAAPGQYPVHLAMHIFKDTHFDFLRWRWHAIALSWVVILAGAFVFFTRGIPLGIEFAGGTAVIVKFDQPVPAQNVRAAMDKSFPGGADNIIIQSYGDPSQNMYMIRVPSVGAESGAAQSLTKQQVVDALTTNNVGKFTEVGTEIVGPVVATIHDLLVTLAFLAIFRYDMSLNVIAAILTMTGYSTNDTIVIFDR